MIAEDPDSGSSQFKRVVNIFYNTKPRDEIPAAVERLRFVWIFLFVHSRIFMVALDIVFVCVIL